jgi:hypothetical protein
MEVRRAIGALNVLFEEWIVSAHAVLDDLRNDVHVIHETNKEITPRGLQDLYRCLEAVLIPPDAICSLWRERCEAPNLDEKFALFMIAGKRQVRLQSDGSSVLKLLCGFVDQDCISNNGGLPHIAFKIQIADPDVV